MAADHLGLVGEMCRHGKAVPPVVGFDVLLLRLLIKAILFMIFLRFGPSGLDLGPSTLWGNVQFFEGWRN